MQFTLSATAVLAMAVSVLAQTEGFNPVYTPEENARLPAGAPFEITWQAPAEYADGTVSITLIGGVDQDHQVPLQEIAAGVPNSDETFTWTVDPALGAESVYGLLFRYESQPDVIQYSMPFKIDSSAAPVETGDSTVTITSAFGTKTVSLSVEPTTSTSTSAEPTTTTVSSTSAVSTSSSSSSSVVSSSSFTPVSSTVVSVIPTPSFVTSTQTEEPTASESEPAPAETTPAGSGAGSLVAPFVGFAGLVMAFMAL